MNDSPSNVFQFGGGGKLYADAREQEILRDRPVSAQDYAPDPPPWADMPAMVPGREPDKEPESAKPAVPSVVTPKNLPEKPAEPGFDWRELFSTLLELTGITAITVGGWLIAPFVGLIIAGIALVLYGAVTSRAMSGR